MGGFKPKNLPWEGYGYFQEQHIGTVRQLRKVTGRGKMRRECMHDSRSLIFAGKIWENCNINVLGIPKLNKASVHEASTLYAS